MLPRSMPFVIDENESRTVFAKTINTTRSLSISLIVHEETNVFFYHEKNYYLDFFSFLFPLIDGSIGEIEML